MMERGLHGFAGIVQSALWALSIFTSDSKEKSNISRFILYKKKIMLVPSACLGIL